jgi:hypothetical protein
LSPAKAKGGDIMEEQFIEQAGRHLSYMRLIVEGAVSLYEDDLGNCDRLVYDLVGEALYTLRIHICDFQMQHQQEIQRELQGKDNRKGDT